MDSTAKSYDQMTPEELLAQYNKYERMLLSMGKDYQNIPEGSFEIIEGWLNQQGYEIVQPQRGLSTIRRTAS